MKRVMIIGQPGSGKSHLARVLGEKSGLPVVHIDKIHWKPGWVERSREEKTRLCRQVHAQDSWIFEGGHSVTWPERLERADTLIWLDLPLWRRMAIVIVRTLRHRGTSRPDLPENCPERFSAEFLSWMWNTRTSARRNCQKTYELAAQGKIRMRFQNHRAVNVWLDQL